MTPFLSTTYTLTATGAGGTVTCPATVTVTVLPPAPVCTLSANPTSVAPGGSSTLTWTTQNATSISLNQGIGGVAASGSQSVTPSGTTTYILTASGNGGTVTCPATVTVTTVPPAPVCTLTASDSSIRSGESATLHWTSSNVTSGTLSTGLTLTPVASGDVNVSPSSDTTYTATFTGPYGSVTCSAPIVVETVGCSGSCGGGGHGGGTRGKPRVVLDSLKAPSEEPFAFVYLSETPYTGLDLGPMGTALYWIVLISWSAALAYLVLFNAVPFALARAKSFGGDVKDALNADPHASVAHGGHAAAHSAPAHAPAHVAHSAHAPAAPARGMGYVAHDGFKSFATSEALSIDDIVKGLARMPENAPVFQAREQEAHANVEPIHPSPVQYAAPEAPVAAAPAPAKAEGTPISDNVHDFIKALLDGDRDTVFGMVRKIAREGGDTEAFLTHTVCALDEAYRSCIDGTTCHPDIAALTKGCHPSFLERLVSSLTTAVDGSYSAGITGVKLGLTRALGVVQG